MPDPTSKIILEELRLNREKIDEVKDELKDELGNMRVSLHTLAVQHGETTKRLDKLENFKGKAVAVLTALGLGSGATGSWLSKLFGG